MVTASRLPAYPWRGFIQFLATPNQQRMQNVPPDEQDSPLCDLTFHLFAR